MEDEGASPGPRGQPQQSFRSTSSINWRVKDDTPRQESPQQGRFRRDNNASYEQNQSSPRGGGYGRRTNQEYQPRDREPREIPSQPDTPRLYVGNLLYTAQSADVNEFFSNNGFNVVNVSMSIDPATGRNPSYCFVDLESVEDAARAMEQLNGAEVLGRSVRINPGVVRKDGQSGGQRRPYGSGGNPGWREREGNGSLENANPRGSNERWGSGRPEGSYNRPQPADQGKRVYIGGLPPIEPQSAVEAEISTLLSRAEPPIEFVSVTNLIAPHPSKAGEPGDHHYLFVDLKTEADAERAIDVFNDVESPWSEGGRLKVNRARENRDRDRDGARRGGRDGFSRGPYGRGGGGGWRSEQ